MAQERLEYAERQCRGSLTELRRLEATIDPMHKKHALTEEEASALDSVKPTDEEIEARAMRLITQTHEDELRWLDEEIALLAP